jgi:hypothetical protein
MKGGWCQIHQETGKKYRELVPNTTGNWCQKGQGLVSNKTGGWCLKPQGQVPNMTGDWYKKRRGTGANTERVWYLGSGNVPTLFLHTGSTVLPIVCTSCINL